MTGTEPAPWLVLADDRTGALETAGALAEHFGPIPVLAWPATPGVSTVGRAVVLDLASRHLDPGEAARRVGIAVEGAAGCRVLLKLDSTLRGNWATEALAVHRMLGVPVLIVPAFPTAGRTCTDGVVREHGVPVSEGAAGRDPRHPVRSSRPVDHLLGAGADQTVTGVPNWTTAIAELTVAELTGDAVIVVGDATTEGDLLGYASAWHGSPSVVLVGTAATLGAAALTDRDPGPAGRPRPPGFRSPVLVVCGSLHPTARDQLAALHAAGWPVVETREAALAALARGGRAALITPVPPATGTPTVGPGAAQVLATAARRVVDESPVATLVLVGGDTADAFLGDDPVVVGGLVGPGMPWLVPKRAEAPLVVTKPGGFGGPTTLIDLLGGRMFG